MGSLRDEIPGKIVDFAITASACFTPCFYTRGDTMQSRWRGPPPRRKSRRFCWLEEKESFAPYVLPWKRRSKSGNSSSFRNDGRRKTAKSTRPASRKTSSFSATETVRALCFHVGVFLHFVFFVFNFFVGYDKSSAFANLQSLENTPLGSEPTGTIFQEDQVVSRRAENLDGDIVKNAAPNLEQETAPKRSPISSTLDGSSRPDPDGRAQLQNADADSRARTSSRSSFDAISTATSRTDHDTENDQKLRNLQAAVTVRSDGRWKFPAGTKISFESYSNMNQNAFGAGAPASTDFTSRINLLAGYPYGKVTVNAVTFDFPIAQHPDPQIKLVDFTLEDTSKCYESSAVPMGLYDIQPPLGSTSPPQFFIPDITRDTGLQMGHGFNQIFGSNTNGGTNRFQFEVGGQYQICYAPTGNFNDTTTITSASSLPQIYVAGVWRQECVTNTNDFNNGIFRDGCFEFGSVWNCYFPWHQQTISPALLDIAPDRTCYFDFRNDVTTGEKKDPLAQKGFRIYQGTVSELSFTQIWNPDSITEGVLFGSEPKLCALPAQNSYTLWEQTVWDQTSLEQSFTEQAREKTFAEVKDVTNIWTYHKNFDDSSPYRVPRVREDQELGFTLTLCYCPNYDSPLDNDATACNSGYEFIQNLGHLRYWTFLICDKTNYVNCEYQNQLHASFNPRYQPYSRVTPQQPFVLKVLCPPGGCDNTVTQRMRILDYSATTSDRMAWEELQQCREWNVPVIYTQTSTTQLVDFMDHLGFDTSVIGPDLISYTQRFSCAYNATEVIANLTSEKAQTALYKLFGGAPIYEENEVDLTPNVSNDSNNTELNRTLVGFTDRTPEGTSLFANDTVISDYIAETIHNTSVLVNDPVAREVIKCLYGPDTYITRLRLGALWQSLKQTIWTAPVAQTDVTKLETTFTEVTQGDIDGYSGRSWNAWYTLPVDVHSSAAAVDVNATNETDTSADATSSSTTTEEVSTDENATNGTTVDANITAGPLLETCTPSTNFGTTINAVRDGCLYGHFAGGNGVHQNGLDLFLSITNSDTQFDADNTGANVDGTTGCHVGETYATYQMVVAQESEVKLYMEVATESSTVPNDDSFCIDLPYVNKTTTWPEVWNTGFGSVDQIFRERVVSLNQQADSGGIWSDADNGTSFVLPVGTHNLTVRPREDGARLSTIRMEVLSGDAQFQLMETLFNETEVRPALNFCRNNQNSILTTTINAAADGCLFGKFTAKTWVPDGSTYVSVANADTDFIESIVGNDRTTGCNVCNPASSIGNCFKTVPHNRAEYQIVAVVDSKIKIQMEVQPEDSSSTNKHLDDSFCLTIAGPGSVDFSDIPSSFTLSPWHCGGVTTWTTKAVSVRQTHTGDESVASATSSDLDTGGTEWTLAAGVHTLVVSPREKGAQLRGISMTVVSGNVGFQPISIGPSYPSTTTTSTTSTTSTTTTTPLDINILSSEPGILKTNVLPAFNLTLIRNNTVYLPATSAWDTSDRIWPTPIQRELDQVNPDPTKPSKTLSGGARADFKTFGLESPVPSALFGQYDQIYDICYCHKDCDHATNYFKVGNVQLAKKIGLASRTKSVIDAKTLNAVRQVQAAGALTFYGMVSSRLNNLDPHDTGPFRNTGLFYMLSYDVENILDPVPGQSFYTASELTVVSRKTDVAGKTTIERAYGFDRRIPSENLFASRMSEECRKKYYSPDLMEQGPSNDVFVKQYVAMNHNNEDMQYYAFTGTSQDFPRSVIMKKPGNVLLCYCARLTDQNDCFDTKSWMYINRFMVQGPVLQQLRLPRGRTVGVQLKGFGFLGTDTYRVIAATRSCSERGNFPPGIQTYSTNCPGTFPNDLTCGPPIIDHDLPLFTTSSQDLGIMITAFEVTPTNVTITFNSSIQGFLRDDDMLLIDHTSVGTNGRKATDLTWTKRDEDETLKVCGKGKYLDTNEAYNIGIRARIKRRISTSTGEIRLDYTKMTLAVSASEGESPTRTFEVLSSEGVSWRVTNRARTEYFLKSTIVQAGLKLCWGVLDSTTASQKYYAPAAELDFYTPPQGIFEIYPISAKSFQIQPVVMAWFPIATAKFGTQFPDSGATMLTFRFTNVEEYMAPLGPFDPDRAGEDSMNMGLSNPTSYVTMKDASQAICGYLFMELYSNDADGFPPPKGCFYGPVMQDKGVLQNGQNMEPRYRDIHMLFEPYQLKGWCVHESLNVQGVLTYTPLRCEYQFVINARQQQIRLADPKVVAVELSVTCVPSLTLPQGIVDITGNIPFGRLYDGFTEEEQAKCGGEEFYTYEVGSGALGLYAETREGPQYDSIPGIGTGRKDRELQRMRILDRPPPDFGTDVQDQFENLVLGYQHGLIKDINRPMPNPLVTVGTLKEESADESSVHETLLRNHPIFYFHDPDLKTYDLYDRHFLRRLNLLEPYETELQLDDGPNVDTGQKLWDLIGLLEQYLPSEDGALWWSGKIFVDTVDVETKTNPQGEVYQEIDVDSSEHIGSTEQDVVVSFHVPDPIRDIEGKSGKLEVEVLAPHMYEFSTQCLVSQESMVASIEADGTTIFYPQNMTRVDAKILNAIPWPTTTTTTTKCRPTTCGAWTTRQG
ncbi:unnamed protein product [Amoebophrya sp. A120]|nr:unnamed protein product [Amoebophrya sp. A120]|eukprot:GSA120T00024974001.1